MLSVKSTMKCIGIDLSSRASILCNLLGFFHSHVPKDPDLSLNAQISLREELETLQNKYINLNIIRVGIDNFTPAEIDKIDYAIYKTRKIYRAVSSEGLGNIIFPLGIGRIEHYDISSSASGGKDDLSSLAEAEDLVREWSVKNNGIDIFIVKNISAEGENEFHGASITNGPCDKDDNTLLNGLVGGEVSRGHDEVARTLAHEIGHYLGLKHNHGSSCPSTKAEKDNLMCISDCCNSKRYSVKLDNEQRKVILSHCSVQDGCIYGDN